MATNRISSADAVRNFEIIQSRIQAGEKFVIEPAHGSVDETTSAMPKGRLLSAVVDGLRAKESGMREVPVLDPELAEVVEERIHNRKPRELTRWA